MLRTNSGFIKKIQHPNCMACGLIFTDKWMKRISDIDNKRISFTWFQKFYKF